jgi:polar amino acid transport system substrate-binding protein
MNRDKRMLKRSCFTIFTLTLTLFVSLQTTPTLAGVEEIEYAYPDISVWTTERDSTGKLKNPLVKLAQPLFEKAGIPWHAQDYPAKRMFSNLRDGTSKFSMLVNAESILQGCCLVSKAPVAVVDIRVFNRVGLPPIKTDEDLNGKSIITIRGYSYAGTLKYIEDAKNNVTNNPAPNHFAAFEMFANGRADYIIDYAKPAAEVLEKSPLKDIAYSSLKQTNVYLILHKSYPDAKNVMARLEEIAATLNKDEFINQPNLKE